MCYPSSGQAFCAATSSSSGRRCPPVLAQGGGRARRGVVVGTEPSCLSKVPRVRQIKVHIWGCGADEGELQRARGVANPHSPSPPPEAPPAPRGLVQALRGPGTTTWPGPRWGGGAAGTAPGREHQARVGTKSLHTTCCPGIQGSPQAWGPKVSSPWPLPPSKASGAFWGAGTDPPRPPYWEGELWGGLNHTPALWLRSPLGCVYTGWGARG